MIYLGKAACLRGIFADGTPFQFSEDDLAIDFFGNQVNCCSRPPYFCYTDKIQLRSAGYQYLGNEEMYSGVSGSILSLASLTPF